MNVLKSIVPIAMVSLLTSNAFPAVTGNSPDGPEILSQHCMSCHTQHGVWEKLHSDQDWVDSGLVAVDADGKGDPSQSEIVIKSRHNPYNNAGNMPLVENGYGAEELQIVIRWIESIRAKPLTP